MGKASRNRWDGNVKSMEIIAKNIADITAEDVAFLRVNYTSSGGLIPNAYAGGAFFTPTHVAKFVWDVLKPRLPANPSVLEPSVGAGVFLEHAPEGSEITALELDETSAKVTSLLYPRTNVILGDAMAHDKRDYYDLVIGNPPYGVTVEFDAGDEDWTLGKQKGLRRGRSEIAFLELAIKAVKPGGYIAFVLPMGIAFGNYGAKLRKFMHATCWQVATILLPGETFVHVGTSIPTQIIIIRKAPVGTPLIEPATKRWGSSRGSAYGDIGSYEAEFLVGQPPAYFARITDIGWDAKGKSTIGREGVTQLDELIEDLTDGGLMRDNLYPHIPSWHDIKDNASFFFTNGNDSCDGFNDASRTYGEHAPMRWQELTLGAGAEIEYKGVDYSTMPDDMEALQDVIIAEVSI